MRNVHSYQGGAVDGRPVLGTTWVYIGHDSVSAWKCSYVSGQCKRMCERTTEHKGQVSGKADGLSGFVPRAGGRRVKTIIFVRL